MDRPSTCDVSTCPPRGARCSPCPQLRTEDDSRTTITEGLRLFNYYDGVWGYVGDIDEETGWFHLYANEDRTGGYTHLNGVRTSIYDPKDRT